MSKRVLYVGSLSATTSDYQLRDLFGPYCVVAHTYIVRHKHDGKSAGYGFGGNGLGRTSLECCRRP